MNRKKFGIPSDVIVLAAFALLAVSLIWNTTRVVARNYELQGRVDELKAEISVLEVQNQNLAYTIEFYKTDTFLELEARENFNKAKSGERVALLDKDSNPKDPIPVREDDVELETSNMQKWIDFLSGKVTGGLDG